MARCPFARWRPLRENDTQGHIVPRAWILHTAWSNADSLFNFFQNSSNLESHFYIAKNGDIEQYLDTTVRADANLNANDFALSVETWDGRTIREWTHEQVTSLIRLLDWGCDVHNIPRRQIPGPYSSGIGWHVQFGAPGPWTPVAKSCPGQPRIDQTRNIIIPAVAKGLDDVSYDDAYRAIRDYFNAKIPNPREDAAPGTMTTLRTQIQFNDWRSVRVRDYIRTLIEPLYDDETKLMNAVNRAEQSIKDEIIDNASPEEIARAIKDELPAAVLDALRELFREENPS